MKFRCKVCGYIYEGDELPADYVCPLCKKGPEVFEVVEEEPAATPEPAPRPETRKTRKFRCRVCGYIYEGEELPADYVCPLCKKGPEAFDLIEDESIQASGPATAAEPAGDFGRQSSGPEQPCTYRCSVCGNVYTGNELPAGYTCPFCKKGPEFYHLIEGGKAGTANSLAGSRTEKNIAAAFAAESLSCSRYHAYSETAKGEGLGQVAEKFLAAARNDMALSRIWLGLLGSSADTAENLKNAADRDSLGTSETYEGFARTAEEEGFTDAAEKFRQAAAVRKTHEERFRVLLSCIEEQRVLPRGDQTLWECQNCGHIAESATPPGSCPLCGLAGTFEMLKAGH